MVQLQRFKKAATVAGTFAFALLIGFVMQYGDADASRFNLSDADMQPDALPAELDGSPLERTTLLTPKTLAPIQLSTNLSETVRFDAESVKLTALATDTDDLTLSRRQGYTATADQQEAPTCPITFAPVVETNAIVTLTISSDCRQDMAFELRHNDLVVSGLTDDAGIATLTVPAFELNSTYAVTFEDGMIGTTSVAVPDADGFNHVVLQWADVPGDYITYRDDLETPLGSILRLGTDTGASNRFAEVYTLAAAQPLAEGLQDLSLRADVTSANCERPFLAERFHVLPGTETQRKDIRITLPSCDYAGTYLELKKVLGGQTLLP